MTKPFSPRELVARVKAALRRLATLQVGSTDARVLAFRHLRMDTGARQVFVKEQLVELTALEFDILRVLVEHHGRVLSRSQILEKVWGGSYFGETRVVDVHIGHIRRKIGEQLIATVRGVGYRFEDQPV